MAADPATAVLLSVLLCHCTSKKPAHLPSCCCGWSVVLYEFTVLLVKHLILHRCRKQPFYQGTHSRQVFLSVLWISWKREVCFVLSRKWIALTLKCLFKGFHGPYLTLILTLIGQIKSPLRLPSLAWRTFVIKTTALWHKTIFCLRTADLPLESDLQACGCVWLHRLSWGGLYFSFSLFKFLRKGPFAKSEPFHLYFFNENGQYLFFSLVSIFLFIFLLLLSKFSEIPCFSDVLKTLGNKGKSAAPWPQLRLLHLAAKKLKAKPSQSWNTSKIFQKLWKT